MNATVNVVLYTSKTLANGNHPLMIRICKDNKKKYKSIGISLDSKYWDEKKNQPRRNCPNREYIKSIISEKMIEYSNQILEYKSESKSFTASNLLKKVDGDAVSKTVEELIKSEIGRLESEGRLKYASTYKDLQSSMINFNTHLDIYFSDIDFEWLVRYETWLRKSNLLLNSIGVRFRTLRALYNRAIQLNYVKSEHYPFREYKVSKLKEETVKRSISKIQIDEIINYKTERWYTQFAIDLFYFSYLLAGINFNDIAKLRHDNIIEGRLVYTRSKTKKLIKLPIQDNAMKLILKYTAKDNPYIFPILTAFHKTDLQKLNRIHKVLGIINKSLENVGEDLGLPLKLTTYVARHTYATVLKRSGVNTSIISESLGHSSEKVTQIYLDSFENSQIEEAMKNLL